MKIIFRLLLLASVASQIHCASNSTSTDGGQDNELTYSVPQQNDPAKMSAPYVVMVSLDGYRHDYNELHNAKNLLAIAASGVAAKSLKPVYPSKTFPNHFSIATGMYAENHGIVSNEFYDPERKETYALSDRNAVSDGSWYLSDCKARGTSCPQAWRRNSVRLPPGWARFSNTRSSAKTRNTTPRNSAPSSNTSCDRFSAPCQVSRT